MGHLTAASLDAYARAQVSYGERLVASHTPDGNGCCRRCGRLAPCDLAVHGRLLMEHFGDLGSRSGELSGEHRTKPPRSNVRS